MQTYDIAIATNGVRLIHVNANFIYFLEGSAGGADATIAIQPQTGSQIILLKPGQSFRLQPGQENQNWTITNHKKEGTIAGRILMGLGDFADNRISGSVEVVDGGKFRTMANAAFMGTIYSGQTPGHYAATQLANPAGSGKRLVVKLASALSVNAGTTVALFPRVALLANVSPYTPQNKHINVAAASPAVFRWETNAALFTSGADAALFYLSMQSANSRDSVTLQEPMVVNPGQSLMMQCAIVNSGFTANFEWTEEAI